MNLTIDIGNSQIFFGIFDREKLILKFKKNSKNSFSSDEMGIFILSILEKNKIKSNKFKYVSLASVVPSITNTVIESIEKYINPQKIILLAPGLKTGINIRYKNPQEVGADRVGNCIGAQYLYGTNKNYIIVDIGTATTFDILSKNEYLGGFIIPGIQMQINSLFSSTAKLPQVELVKPKEINIDNTISAIQCGVYYFNLLGIKEIINLLKMRFFQNNQDENVFIIGTGGTSEIFKDEKIFDTINQDLILFGLNRLIELNC